VSPSHREHATPVILLSPSPPPPHLPNLARSLSESGYDTTTCTSLDHDEFTKDVQKLHGAIPPHVVVLKGGGVGMVLKHCLSWPIMVLVAEEEVGDVVGEGEGEEEGIMEGVDVVPCFWGVGLDDVRDVLDEM